MVLKKGILSVLGANVISLIFNLLTSFLLPKYLSVDVYATIKTFQLYVVYIGLLHLGYADGMYLRYGGVSASKIEKEKLVEDIATMRLFQIIISLITVSVCLFIHDNVWLAFAISVVPLNMASYYKLLCQATGEFTEYGRVMNATTIVTFLLNMILLFVFRQRDSSYFYIAAYVLVYIAIWLYSEYIIKKTFHLSRLSGHCSFSVLKHNVVDGILLMLGNLSTAFLTGMDRWFVKYLMNMLAFAQYSFAVSIENFLNVAVTPVSVTLYNYFCINHRKEELEKIKGLIYVLAVGLPACAFPAKWILEHFLQKYIDSASVLFLLFAAQMFAIIVKCLYINLYKVFRKQRRYFLKLTGVIVAGFIFNVVCYMLLHSKEAFALGTLASNMLWFVISSFDFKSLKPSLKEGVYLFLEVLIFLLCGYYLNSIIGFFAYAVISVILTRILMKQTVVYGLEIFKKR